MVDKNVCDRPDMEITLGRKIGSAHPCFVIAEIGQNHQGAIEIAKQLIKVAKESGADCVKFQKSCLSEKFTKAALNRKYSGEHSWGDTYGAHKAKLEFSDEQFVQLQDYATNQIGIPFTASAMDTVSLDFLHSIGVPFIKIGSGDADNEILIERAAKKGIPLVISTGMSDMNVVDRIHDIVLREHDKLVLLHCVSAYPTPADQTNLRVIQTYSCRFPQIHVGYSGHESGHTVTLAAIALGAKVIERHLTLNKDWKGNDHKCSLEPEEFSDMVRKIREVETALGSASKKVQPCELECKRKLGKSLVVAADTIPAGSILSRHHISVKVSEPPGIPSAKLQTTIGATLIQTVYHDQPILESDILHRGSNLGPA